MSKADNLDKTKSVNKLVIGSSGSGSMIRTFSEKTFNPALVPSYVDKIETFRHDGVMYYRYVDDYGRSKAGEI